MDLKKDVEDKLKEAIKKQEKEKISAYRLLLSNIKNKEVEKRRALSQEEFYGVVKSLVRNYQESLESFKRGNRLDLAEKEEKEMEVLLSLLPSPITEEELVNAIEEGIKEVGAKDKRDTGRVIRFIMEKYPGRIDGKTLSEMVLKRLSMRVDSF